MRKLFMLFISVLALYTYGYSNDDDVQKDIKSIEILGLTDDTLRINKDDTYQVNLKIDPSNGLVKYVSNNQKVFKVSDSGLITAVDGGIGWLIIVGANGESWTKTLCTVDVTAYVDSITINGSENYMIADGDKRNLSSAFVAYPITAKNKIFAYKSSNPAIATVDKDGIVIPISRGIVEITATSTDGSNIQSKPITIYSKYERKALSKSGWTVTASSYQSSYYGPNKIIDGVNSTIWHCKWSGAGTPPPYWLLIDMKEEKEFDQITLYRYSAYQDTRNVEFYTSSALTDDLGQDDPSFKKIGNINFGDLSNSTTNMTIQYFPEAKIKTRYLKLYLPDTNRERNNSLAELYLYNVE
ncbi:discoidin domain-containing protein [Dysgonomonas sp. Marseille-P4677]|uniref:discoidin domain-containing protein n=1 Tax=Dysgonomonas sp. Marseille-P4677 TaxID=2364790 RepID=UPI001913E51B|nr:discoidin domain-containing protein [Dysgonomonas sp. Marseille-P4677]MBK5722591.1 discoidin domain-containing protein [Dysgonomonas sp. Marseille-P4677]